MSPEVLRDRISFLGPEVAQTVQTEASLENARAFGKVDHPGVRMKADTAFRSAGWGSNMHRLVNFVAAITLLLGVIVVGGWRYERFATGGRENELRAETVRLKREIDRRAAMLETVKGAEGWPRKIDPEWFGDNPPRNMWITGDRPWIEIASAEQMYLQDPVVRAVDARVGADLAEFWYNPANGNIRARVPTGASDRETLAQYNRVNTTSLDSLFESPKWRSARANDR